jgi:hypothetical protein
MPGIPNSGLGLPHFIVLFTVLLSFYQMILDQVVFSRFYCGSVKDECFLFEDRYTVSDFIVGLRTVQMNSRETQVELTVCTADWIGLLVLHVKSNGYLCKVKVKVHPIRGPEGPRGGVEV